jgi:hypothetical protein
MSAVTLGSDELERQLQLIRKRLNLFSLQDALYFGFSSALLGGTLILIAAIYGSTPQFGIVFWSVGALLVAGIAALGVRLRRKWLSLAETARYTDHTAGLECRLATMLANSKPRVRSRLRSMLLAEVFALAPKWEVGVVAPRRVPKSVFLCAASAALFLAVIMLVPEEPPAPLVSAATAPSLGADSADADSSGMSLTALPSGAHPDSFERTNSLQARGAGEAGQGGEKSSGGDHSDAGPPRESSGPPASSAGETEEQAGSDTQDMPAQMQQMIRDAMSGAGEDIEPNRERREHKRDEGAQNAQDEEPGERTEQRAERDEMRDGSSSADKTGRKQPEAEGRRKGGSEADRDPQGGGPKAGGLFAKDGSKEDGTEQAEALLISLTSHSAGSPQEFEPQGDPGELAERETGIVTSDEPAGLGEQQGEEMPLYRPPLRAEHEALLREIFTRPD